MMMEVDSDHTPFSPKQTTENRSPYLDLVTVKAREDAIDNPCTHKTNPGCVDRSIVILECGITIGEQIIYPGMGNDWPKWSHNFSQ